MLFGFGCCELLVVVWFVLFDCCLLCLCLFGFGVWVCCRFWVGLFVDGFVIVWIGFGLSWILFACCVCLGLTLRFVLVIFDVGVLGWFRVFCCLFFGVGDCCCGVGVGFWVWFSFLCSIVFFCYY